jgi:hypothetical protein
MRTETLEILQGMKLHIGLGADSFKVTHLKIQENSTDTT